MKNPIVVICCALVGLFLCINAWAGCPSSDNAPKAVDVQFTLKGAKDPVELGSKLVDSLQLSGNYTFITGSDHRSGFGVEVDAAVVKVGLYNKVKLSIGPAYTVVFTDDVNEQLVGAGLGLDLSKQGEAIDRFKNSLPLVRVVPLSFKNLNVGGFLGTPVDDAVFAGGIKVGGVSF